MHKSHLNQKRKTKKVRRKEKKGRKPKFLLFSYYVIKEGVFFLAK